jgi:hypothetical protein
MDATVYPSLPPTYNTLDSADRIRLLRTARKVGDILGTTPHLVESTALPVTLLPIGPPPESPVDWRKHRRYGSIFTNASVTSLASIASSSSSSSFVSLNEEDESTCNAAPTKKSKRSAERPRPRPLLLRLNHAVPAVSVELPITPNPLTSHNAEKSAMFPPTPSTPVFTPNPACVRRRKLAKLARHLGENVPPELVFPTASPVEERHQRAGKRRSMSVSELSGGKYAPLPSANASGASQKALNGGAGWVGQWNRSDIRDVQRELRTLRAR